MLNFIVLFTLVRELFSALLLSFRSSASKDREIQFLRRQLAHFAERRIKPRRPRPEDRALLALLARLFPWKDALIIVRPATLIRWQRELARNFWRWKSRPIGRQPLASELRALITRMLSENPLWGEDRISDELLLKFGLRVSPRTVSKYLTQSPPSRRRSDTQTWKTFMRNHGKAVVACDFVVSMTLGFKIVYTLVVMEIGSRRIIHIATTSHPNASWTTQQLREAIPADHQYRFLLHDRDAIFSAELDRSIQRLGLRILKSPPRAPKANAFCERLIGTLRRECLDHIIPISENHIRAVVREWAKHYNRGRPHGSLGPSVPQPSANVPCRLQPTRHYLPPGSRVVATPILNGLHHEYALADAA